MRPRARNPCSLDRERDSTDSSGFANGTESEEDEDTAGEEAGSTETQKEKEAASVEQLLLHNAALRRNFDCLKKLYVKLTQANLNLKEPCGNCQCGKAEVLVEELNALKKARDAASDLAMDVERRVKILETENHDLMHKIEIMRMEKDQAIAEKHSAQMEYAKLYALKGDDKFCRQKVGDLAHKQCEHLEIDLEKACLAGEAAHEQLLTVTYEKDIVILELEQVIKQLEENICTLEEQRASEQKDWEKERQKLQALIHEEERIEQQQHAVFREEEARQKEIRRTLEGEMADLRAMLTALEEAATDAELRHAEAITLAIQEKESISRELQEIKKESKQNRESFLGSQKELTELHAESGGLRSQLQDALHEIHQYKQDAENSRIMKEELQQSLRMMQIDVTDLVKQRQEDHITFIQQLEQSKSHFNLEKETLLREKATAFKEKGKKLHYKIELLKKRLKQSYKLLAVMTSDYNQLMVRLREYEATSTPRHEIKRKKDLHSMIERVQVNPHLPSMPNGDSIANSRKPSKTIDKLAFRERSPLAISHSNATQLISTKATGSMIY